MNSSKNATETLISTPYFNNENTDEHSTPQSPAYAVHISNLKISYSNKTVVFCEEIKIRSGSIMAIVGPSGCGKSSLLSSINRMLDLTPNSKAEGSIKIDNSEILNTNIDLISLRKKVGMVFQKPNPFPKSIRENLAFPLREHGITEKKEVDHKIESALKNVGLWEEIKDGLQRSALELSGGQQQRLCIARAIILEPEILLLDEPCSALDPISSGVVEDYISNLKGKYTIIMVTHNIAQAKRIADFVSVCWYSDNCGCVVETGPTEQIFNNPVNLVTKSYISGLRG